MRGSCILSAGILIVIAGITSTPSGTQQHRQQLDKQLNKAMATTTSFQSQAAALLLSPSSCAASPYNLPGIPHPGFGKNVWLSWNATRYSNTYDPLPVLLAGHGIQDCLRTETKPNHHAFAPLPSKPSKAIYPQPISYYLAEKAPQDQLDHSRIRVVKLKEFSPLRNAQQSFAQLLPTIDQFLATFPIRLVKPKQPTRNQIASTQESWTQAPYFQKYGYKYTMNEESEQEEPKQEAQDTDLAADDTEDWTQAPYFLKYGYDYTKNEAKTSDLATDTTNSSSGAEDQPSKPTVPEFVSNPINGTIESETETEVAENSSWFSDTVTTNEWFGLPDEATEKSVASNEATPIEEEENYEDNFDYYADDYLAYEGKYQMFYEDDYEIEYEAYEEDMLGETTDEKDDTDQGEATTESSQEEVEEEYETSPATPSGSFDIYWEETDPNVL